MIDYVKEAKKKERVWTSEEIAKYKEDAIKYVSEQKLSPEMETQKETVIDKFKQMTDEEVIVELNLRMNEDEFNKNVQLVKQFGIHTPFLTPVRDVKPEEFGSEALLDALKKLECTLVASRGFCLASSQIGIEFNILVVPIVGFQGVQFLINPKIVEQSATSYDFDERSLSIIGHTFENVKRSRAILLEYQDHYGNVHREEFGVEDDVLGQQDYTAKFKNREYPEDEQWSIWICRAIQHGMELLAGKSLVDGLSFLRKDIIKRKTRKAYNKAQKTVERIYNPKR